MIVAGIGCRTGVAAEAILSLLEEATSLLAVRGLDPRSYLPERPSATVAPQVVDPGNESVGDGEAGGGERVAALAIPAFRRDEPGIAEAATRLNLPIIWVERAALKGEQGRCLTRSARAEAEVGLSCVAEAAALSAAGNCSRLVVPRIAGGGVTCALAEGPGDR